MLVKSRYEEDFLVCDAGQKGKTVFKSKDESARDKWFSENEKTYVAPILESQPTVSTMVQPTSVAAVDEKTIHRFIFEMVDSYHKQGQPCPKQEFEGENVGISGVLSTIAIPLRLDFQTEKDGSTKEEIVFIPHTFIQKMIHETFFEKKG